MKKAVISILGIQGGFVANGQAKFSNSDHRAKYYFDGSNEIKEYFNTLPLLIDNYDTEYKIVPIYTQDAKIFNETVMNQFYPQLNIVFDDNYLIKEEKNFKEIFSLFNHTVEEFDEVIIDVTHGFRHLPLLMLIDLMIINFKDINKVSKILFAKEIDKHTPREVGLYEIIDLKDYLDLANISYALSSFNRNYTISNHIKTNNQNYNEFLTELSKFSKHILANSLDALIISSNKKSSIAKRIIKIIDKILDNNDDILKNFEPFLLEVREHIAKIESYKDLEYYQRLYKLSQNMLEKGYLLNSITLLSEAVGLYSKELFKDINSDVKNFIEEFETKVQLHKNNSKKYQLYSLSNQSKMLYKLGSGFNGNFLKLKYPTDKERKFNQQASDITIHIKHYLLNIRRTNDYKKTVELINSIDILRNNLAHGNSSERLEDVENDIKEVLSGFENWIGNI